MATTILLTGFEPFGADSENPSARVAQALDGATLGSLRIRSLILPVDAAAAPPLLLRALREAGPRVLLMTGLANGRPAVSLERLAVNVADFGMPDNAGAQPCGEPIIAGAPAAYASTLPLERCRARLEAADIPAEISNSAGTYLCNLVSFVALHHAATSVLACGAGFVHLPYHTAYAAHLPRPQPSLPLELLVTAVRHVLEESVQ